MRTLITASTSAALLFASLLAGPAMAGGYGGYGGYGNNGHGGNGHDDDWDHGDDWGHHGHGSHCKKIVIWVPKWTPVAWGSHHDHHHRVHYIKKVIVICHPPFSP